MKLTSNQSLFIDLLRGLSAVAVMVGHSMGALDSPPTIEWFKIQSCAVVVFFVLSGFLICWTSAKKVRYSFGEYFIDRFSRIFVAFIPALALTLAIDAFSGPLGARHSINSLFANLGMFQGIPFDRIIPGGPFYAGYGTNSPLWTVAVEWWLYMAFGIVFFSSRLRGLAITGAALLAAPAVAVIALYSLRESLSTTWIIAALVAAPIAMLSAEQAKRFAWAGLVLSLILLIIKVNYLRQLSAFPAYDAHLMLTVTFTILSAIAALKSIQVPFMSYAAAPIKWFSNVSYSLYLIHYPILIAFLKVFPAPLSVPTFLTYNLIGLLSAQLFTLAFDRHHTKVAGWLKRRLLQSAMQLD